MALSNFVNGYTFVLFLFIHDVLYAHVMYTLHKKNVACCTKNYVVSTKKYRSYVAHQKLCESEKYLLWQQKKLCDTQKKDSC